MRDRLVWCMCGYSVALEIEGKYCMFFLVLRFFSLFHAFSLVDVSDLG